jgi:hypothetical protein
VKIFTAPERLAEPQGVSVLLVGPTGIGKTWLLTTVPPPLLPVVLAGDIEAGFSPVNHLPIASVRPRTAQELLDIACAVGGPDPALPASSAFSTAHYAKVSSDPELMKLAEYQIYFIDSLTAAGRLFFTHCEQLPESTSDRGKKDLRAVYGAFARLMVAWMRQWQMARGKTVIFVAILERQTDDFGTSVWGVQLDGAKAARELPGIVDQVVSMVAIDFGDRKPVRAFVCTADNPWGYPAKDRSGRLEMIEPPDLGKLLAKLTSSPSST